MRGFTVSQPRRQRSGVTRLSKQKKVNGKIVVVLTGHGPKSTFADTEHDLEIPIIEKTEEILKYL